MVNQPMPWLPLDNATKLLDHDQSKAREALARGISKSWLMRQGGIPQPTTDPNVPLRVRVVPSPGWRIEGRAWLDIPSSIGKIPKSNAPASPGHLLPKIH